jgi:hypothetical protein
MGAMKQQLDTKTEVNMRGRMNGLGYGWRCRMGAMKQLLDTKTEVNMRGRDGWIAVYVVV